MPIVAVWGELEIERQNVQMKNLKKQKVIMMMHAQVVKDQIKFIMIRSKQLIKILMLV